MKRTFPAQARPSLILACAVLLAALAACSGKNKVKPDKPMRLTDIDTTIQVERVWRAKVGGLPKLRLSLDAATSDGRAYLAGAQGEVQAVDLATGRTKWRTDLRLRLSAGPGVGGDLVVVGGPKGDVVALDAATGRQRWRVKVNSEVLAAPAVNASTVVVRTVDGKLRALEAKDGSQRWLTDQQLPRLTLRGNAPPQILGDRVLAGFDNGRLIAVSLVGGTTLWDVAVGQARGSSELQRLIDVDSAVAVDGDDLFAVSYQGRVARIALETGQVIWAHDISSYRGLAVSKDAVFVSTANGELVKLDRSAGAELWKQSALVRRQLSAPVLVGEQVVVADLEGVMHWINASDGRFAARTKAGGRVSMPPVASDGLVLVDDDQGEVSAWRIRGPAKAKPAKNQGGAQPATSSG